MQKDREHYKREFEKSEREFANELRKRTNDEQFLNDKITDLEAKLDRKRKKIAQIKAVIINKSLTLFTNAFKLLLSGKIRSREGGGHAKT